MRRKKADPWPSYMAEANRRDLEDSRQLSIQILVWTLICLAIPALAALSTFII